jgi:hypothetical protein
VGQFFRATSAFLVARQLREHVFKQLGAGEGCYLNISYFERDFLSSCVPDINFCLNYR